MGFTLESLEEFKQVPIPGPHSKVTTLIRVKLGGAGHQWFKNSRGDVNAQNHCWGAVLGCLGPALEFQRQYNSLSAFQRFWSGFGQFSWMVNWNPKNLSSSVTPRTGFQKASQAHLWELWSTLSLPHPSPFHWPLPPHCPLPRKQCHSMEVTTIHSLLLPASQLCLHKDRDCSSCSQGECLKEEGGGSGGLCTPS